MKNLLILCFTALAGIVSAQDVGSPVNARLRQLSPYGLYPKADSIKLAGLSAGSDSSTSVAGITQLAADGRYKAIGYVPTWAEILLKPPFFSGSYADLTGKPTLFSGAYSDLTGRPTLPGSYFSGAYTDLTGKPTLFSGSYLDLTNRPTLFSGAYTDLTGKPATFAPSAHTHTGTDITQDVTHRFVSDAQIAGWNSSTGSGFSGNYADLINKPTLFSGSYLDLTNKPTLFSGSYTDLSNKPTIPSTAGEVGAVPLSTYTANRTTDQSATATAQNTANSAISIANSGTSVNASQTMSIAALQTDKLDVTTYNANTPGYQTAAQVNTTIASTTATQNTRDNGQDTQIAGKLPNSFSATQATTDANQNTAIGLKQDAVAGKGLSTNDYTTAEKSKLASIASGATDTFDFYVSSLNGDDANSGLSAASAKKTIAAVSALLSAGKSLGIEKGSYFREQLVITAANVTVAAYGTGVKPILDASDVVSTTAITKTAGQTNVYQFQATPVTAGGSSFPFSTFENGQRLARASSIANCDATVGSFYAAGITNATAQTVYIHPIGNTDATLGAKTYEVAVRDDGFESSSTATSLLLSGILCRRNLRNDGTLVVGGIGSTVNDCIAEDGTKHVLFVTDNCTVNDCVARKSESTDSYFIYYTITGAGSLGTTFNRCSAIGGYAYNQASSAYTTGAGWFAHSATTRPALMTINDCYAENLTAGFGGDVTTLNITRCRTVLVGSALSAVGGASDKVSNTTACFFDQRTGASYQKASGDSRALLSIGTGTHTIQGCVLLTNPGAYGEFGYFNDANTVITFTKNTVVCTGGAASFAGISKGGTGLLSLDRNIFYGVGDVYSNYSGNAAAGNISATNNVYFRTSGTLNFRKNNTDYSGFAAWQASGQDANGLNVNPAFVNLPTTWTKIGNAAVSASNVVALQAGATYYTPLP